jgi:hypothetical protein
VETVTSADVARLVEAAQRDGFRMGVAWAFEQLADAVRDEHVTQAAEDNAWRISAARQLMESTR